MNKYKKLAFNTMIFAIGSFGSKILVLLLTRLYTNNISPSDSSTKELLEITANFLLPIFTFSMTEAIIRYGLDNKYDKAQVFTTATVLNTLGLVLMLIVSPLFRIVSFLDFIDGYTILLLIYVCTSAFRSLCSQFVRARGMVKLFSLDGILATLTLLIFNLIFIAKLHWGVAGVAWATFIAQGVSSMLSLIALMVELKKLKTTGKVELWSPYSLRRILVLAVPSILQQSFVSVGGLFIQGLVNSFGSSVIAGYGAAIQLNTFAITVFTTSANAVSNYTAQNMGSGRYDRVKEGFRSAVKIDAVIALPFVALYTLCGTFMIKLFMDSPTDAALATGRQFMLITAPFYFIVMVKLTCDGIMRGASAVKYFMISTFSDLLLRVVLAYAFTPYFGSTGIWMSWPVGWVISTVLAVSFYAKGLWKPAKDQTGKP